MRELTIIAPYYRQLFKDNKMIQETAIYLLDLEHLYVTKLMYIHNDDNSYFSHRIINSFAAGTG